MNIPIYETENFEIQAASRPFIDRTEGGHIYIYPKVPVRDRTRLTPALAIEYTKLTMIVGEALIPAMARRGITVGIVNYQDMGNWGVFKPEGPTLHMQIYGRATTATTQKMAMLYSYHIVRLASMIASSRSMKVTFKKSGLI